MRTNPLEDLEELFNTVTRQVEEGMSKGTGFPVPGSIAVDVADTGEEFVVTADLPGYEPGDIELTLTDGTLHLEAERETETTTGDDSADEASTDEEYEGVPAVTSDRYLRRERTRRSVSRRIRLPDPVEKDGVSATHSNGVLTVTLPKVDERQDAKQIDID